MGDIAFCIIVFFVILIKAQDDTHLQWTPAKTDRIDVAGYARASVVIDNKSKLYLNGHELSAGQLSGELKQLLGNLPQGERTVLLKVHREATASRFEPVLEAVAEAGGELVHVLDKKEPGR